MGTDFSAPENAGSYSGREAHASWRTAMTGLAEVAGADVVDLGCGGGVYVRALHELGAAGVLGVDASAPVLARARADHGALPGVVFHHADATATGLPDGCADLVLARALVHHLDDLRAFATEARRLLRPAGRLVVQDRTAEDVLQPAGPGHVRGHLLELVPRLVDVERDRRPTTSGVEDALHRAGLVVTTHRLEETRRSYPDVEDFLDEVAARTGRSLLHELDDAELADLVTGLRERLPPGPLVERDRWTLWLARSSPPAT